MEAKKFGRDYLFRAQQQNGLQLEVKPPFTITFDITRNVLSSANVASFRIYNLNRDHRNGVRKNYTDFDDLRTIVFQAGYEKNLSVAFSGNITQAWSVREGVDFITQIESFDGGFAFANSQFSSAFPTETQLDSVIDAFVSNLADYGVAPGVISGDIEGSLTRGNAYTGNTCDLLDQLTGGQFYIDNGKAYVLADNECILGPVAVINAASGLLNTPIREQTRVKFDMLFEPRLVIGQIVTLESTTADEGLNGVFKVVGVKHRGMISEAVCGDAITSVDLLQPLGFNNLRTVG